LPTEQEFVLVGFQCEQALKYIKEEAQKKKVRTWRVPNLKEMQLVFDNLKKIEKSYEVKIYNIKDKALNIIGNSNEAISQVCRRLDLLASGKEEEEKEILIDLPKAPNVPLYYILRQEMSYLDKLSTDYDCAIDFNKLRVKIKGVMPEEVATIIKSKI